MIDFQSEKQQITADFGGPFLNRLEELGHRRILGMGGVKQLSERNDAAETVFHPFEGFDGLGHVIAGDVGQATGVSVAKLPRLFGQGGHLAVDGRIVGAVE